MKKTAIVYHVFPHYRAAIFKALLASGRELFSLPVETIPAMPLRHGMFPRAPRSGKRPCDASAATFSSRADCCVLRSVVS